MTDEKISSDGPELPTKRPPNLDDAAPKAGSRDTTDTAVAVAPSSLASNVGNDGPGKAPDRAADVPELLSSLEMRLLDAFNQKLTYDNFKEKQIDRLHEEIQGYKSDLILKAVRPLLTTLIKLHADVGRLISGLSREDTAKLTAERIIGFFDSFRDEIVDLLAAQGVETFSAAVNEDRFDPRRQASVGTVETSNSELAGKIAETAQPGFEQGSVLLSKEKVKVYSAARSGPDEPTASPRI